MLRQLSVHLLQAHLIAIQYKVGRLAVDLILREVKMIYENISDSCDPPIFSSIVDPLCNRLGLILDIVSRLDGEDVAVLTFDTDNTASIKFMSPKS